MSYPTLIGEMAKKKITIESMAQFLGLHRNTVSYKLNEGTFCVEEALEVHDEFFPEWDLGKLFERGDK